jgi:hypothetical protein
MEGTIVKRFKLEGTDVEMDLELFPSGDVMARFVGADPEWCVVLDRTLSTDRDVVNSLFRVKPEVTE